MAASVVRLGAQGVTRQFGRVIACDRIDFAAAPGTIHAIVGGNGAGKTTLMRILQGIEQPDDGKVIVDDAPAILANPAAAFARGIGMVHQEFMLVPDLSLLENLILGREPVRRGVIDKPAALSAAKKLATEAGVALDWDLKVAMAPVHLRQILEILRLLYRGADVLILDEPTSVLAPQQVHDLLALLRRLRDEGRTIVFISHKLDEVLAIADRITVLRSGRVVGSTIPAETNASALAQLMVGEAVENPVRSPRAQDDGPPVLAVRGLGALDARGTRRLVEIDLEVKRGEVVGVAGVSGSGQDELVAAIVGLRRAANGVVMLESRDITGDSVAARREAGIGYLSADRAHEGLCLPATIRDNVIAGQHRHRPFAHGGILRPKLVRDHVREVLTRFSVIYGGDVDPVSSLSGGNQQRLVIARELDRRPRILVAAQPTRGVDIAGIASIHRQILAYRDAGGAVLLVSEELEELLALADRIVVLHHGAVTGAIAGDQANPVRIGRMMLGEAA
jgi:simple sugar transport system ATP-binding protein